MPPAAGPPALTTSCRTRRASSAGARQGCLSPERPHRDPARAGGTHFLSTQAAKPLPARDPAEEQTRHCTWWTCWRPCCSRRGSHLCYPHRLPCSRAPGVRPALSAKGSESSTKHNSAASTRPGAGLLLCPGPLDHWHTTRATSLSRWGRRLPPPGGWETQCHTQPDSSSCHSGAMNMRAAPGADRGKGQTVNETARAGAHAGGGGCLLGLLCGRDTAAWVGRAPAASRDTAASPRRPPTQGTASWPPAGRLGAGGCLCTAGLTAVLGGGTVGLVQVSKEAEAAAAPTCGVLTAHTVAGKWPPWPKGARRSPASQEHRAEEGLVCSARKRSAPRGPAQRGKGGRAPGLLGVPALDTCSGVAGTARL